MLTQRNRGHVTDADVTDVAKLASLAPEKSALVKSNMCSAQADVPFVPKADIGSVWIVRPNALAVFKLMTRSNLAGCSTGRSPALAVDGRETIRNLLMQHRRFILVIVPNEVALQLHDFELVVVHLLQLRPDLHVNPFGRRK